MNKLSSTGGRLDSQKKTSKSLADTKMDIKTKLAALWASMMFCYVYGDLLSLYKPGVIEDIMAEALPIGSPESLVAAAIMMVIPIMMIFLSVALPAKTNRPANILVAIGYTGVNLAAFTEPDAYYVFFGAVEVLITLLIIWHAWKWPGETAVASG
ncbi:TPA: hypothetical protein HA259_04885 [Thermoplasmata archaeon]|nr:hypothetical protein [Thermoplasmata archaeon]